WIPVGGSREGVSKIPAVEVLYLGFKHNPVEIGGGEAYPTVEVVAYVDVRRSNIDIEELDEELFSLLRSVPESVVSRGSRFCHRANDISTLVLEVIGEESRAG
ncbi:MAG: hypothetical protein OXI63_07215, partial [Candidatus Poribacteria bacterium]|nr:hypothetical protein [Candidatus Poribacteria bacterium]